MPASALFGAMLETAATRIISQNDGLQTAISQLEGKRLTLFLDVLPKGVAIQFVEQRVRILIIHDSFDTLQKQPLHDACVIRTRVAALDKLRHMSQLTNLIQQGDLQLVGDIQIAQQASNALKDIKFEPEEWLAQRTTDVFAHSFFSVSKDAVSRIKQTAEALSHQLAELMTEERPIAARQQAIDAFKNDVKTLRDDANRLEARIQRLEKARQNNQVSQ